MDESLRKTYLGWLKVLEPEILKRNLINCSLFILAYEIFKQSVIDHPKGFYCHEWENGKWKISQRYKDDVIKLHPKDLFHASCLWFKENDAIDEKDIEKISAIRKHRNEIAHELPSYIAADKNINEDLFFDLFLLLSKVDRWWIINFEVPTNPDFDGQEIDENETYSGNMIMLDMIRRILSGDDQELSELRNIVIGKIQNTTEQRH